MTVPEVRLGRLQGEPGTVGISLAHGTESLDLPIAEPSDPWLSAEVEYATPA